MRHSMKVFAIAIALAASSSITATAKQHDAHHAATSADKGSNTLAEGEVRKIDKAGGKITIKHGPLPNLDMPPMTMVFRVKDPAMLEQVKAGDKVKFAAENINGALTVVQLDASK